MFLSIEEGRVTQSNVKDLEVKGVHDEDPGFEEALLSVKTLS